MPGRGSRIELPIRCISRLVRIELWLRHAGIIDVERIEAAVGTGGNEIAGFQLEKPLTTLAAILRIFTRGFSGLLAHA